VFGSISRTFTGTPKLRFLGTGDCTEVSVLAVHSTHNAVIRCLVDSVAGPNASVHVSMPMGVHFVAVIFYLPQEIHDHYDTKHRTLGCTTRR